MRAHYRLLLLAVAFAFAAESAVAEWKTFRREADGFEASFSGEVKIAETQVTEDTKKRIVRSTDYMQDGGDDFVYIIGASLLKNDVNFDNGVKASYEALKCKTTKTDAAMTFSGGRAHRKSGERCFDDTMRVEARYYTKGKWFYQVIAIFKPAGSTDADRFINSFKVTSK